MRLVLVDNPINEEEGKILNVIGRHGGPYTRIRLSSLDRDDLQMLQSADIEAVISAYLSENDPNYVRLRWFLRRLAQTGIPTSVPLIVNNIHKQLPAIGDAAAYLNSASENFGGNWLQIGDGVLNALEQPVVIHNEYLQLVLLSLFARIAGLNHLDRLVQKYSSLSTLGQREVILAAGNTKTAVSWLQILKNSFAQMESWQRRSFLFSIRQLPKDERKFWIQNNKAGFSALEAFVANDSKNAALNRSMSSSVSSS